MFGIPGLDPVGAIHAGLGLAAVGVGTVMVILDKGTRPHRLVGRLFAALLVGVNGTAFLLYDLLGTWGPFHWLALVSLATLGVGVTVAWLQRPTHWLEMHGRFMSWAYAGLLAAFASEVGVRLPGVGFLPGVIVPSALVIAAAAVLIQVQVPRIVARQS